MFQFAEIIRVARHCYLETGEAGRVQTIGLGVCEDAALDALEELALAGESTPHSIYDDPTRITALSFDCDPFDSDAPLLENHRIN